MKSCTEFILILLGLFIKASSAENSTQVYYIEVHIEAGAYKNFTDFIDNLILDVNSSATVQNFSITTECNSLITGNVNCSCNSGYSWSEEVCQNFSQCCNQNECMFNDPNPRAMCLSNNKVLVNGSFTLADVPYTSSLAESGSQDYNAFVEKYTGKLQQVYSTLGWFDSLKITRLRQGSIIADFVMTVTAPFTSAELENTTKQLQKNNNASFNLIVTGLVKITRIPQFQDPIPYNSKTSIICSTPEVLGRPLWSFQQNAQPSQDITNGTEAIVTYDLQNSTVNINNTIEVWKGTFTCDYMSEQSNSIIYRGSLYLDIALLPEALIISDPQFPSCTGPNKQFYIKVKCIVPNTTENYTVKWTGKKITQDIPVSLENGQTAYQAFEGIFCDEKLEGHDVSCQFQNRLNQTKLFSLYVPIINDDSTICKSELDWPDAKANFNATKLCNPTAVGLQMRYCMANGTWGDLISFCVNQAISKLLNVAMNLQRGLGIVEKQANGIFVRLKLSTDDKSFETFANVNASVGVLESMRDASNIQNSKWNDTAFPDILKSLSNLLNGSLNDSWRPVGNEGNYTLALKYLRAVDGIINQTKFATATNQFQQENVQVKIYNKSDPSTQKTFSSEFGVSVSITETVSNVSVQTAFKNLGSKLPNTLDGKETVPSEIILLVKADKKTKISAEYNQQRLPNHEMYCVYLNEDNSTWSEGGCKWGGVSKPKLCTCDHLSAFTILMAKHPIELKYMEELTYTGLGFSIVSLTLCLVIEFLVWNAVVKTNIAHFRHTVLVNITVCLLIAHCSFLAAPVPSASPPYWCLPLTVMKHFCFLAAFFWMLCLSLGLLHQVIFVFVHLRKKVYLGLCLFLGYICPLVIVIVTFITYDNGRPGSYYSGETCWLIYEAALKGSIHAFLFPVFIIVFVNMFTMVVVISRILKPNLSEGSSHDEKEVARSIVKTIVLLTPTLGITWILGLFVLMLDLTTTPYAQIVNYAFTFFNSFQGFFILLTGCFGEKKVRDALQKRFGRQQSMNYKSESSSRITSATKTK
ncbi:adhesion G-protein coupled receptor F3-like isoform X2 [Pygocentrus nattereri]|nr:adhesion G-protein coupled receptor F3-like isoform X2 [Pygocentrus nattereri]XP_017555432.1 adhesion G-protein coupled receptor F3-like isoform X2 [Pygocentrus nattereri]XP_037397914.1 adhesion G-protein coupled receptor F3-like isoform X2 [Pygocentrus nattereri]XP_037397915.1 adhesion G-protein coupled receptor F3-like isoform X2 [Pygocentrus nattereri]